MRQKIFEIIGKWGCYFLCVIKLAEKVTGRHYGAETLYGVATHHRWMDADCFMRKPEELLGYLTGRTYKMRHDVAGYVPKEGELIVERWEYRPEPGKTLSHFILPDYDPYGDSETVRRGYLVSTRVFTPV